MLLQRRMRALFQWLFQKEADHVLYVKHSRMTRKETRTHGKRGFDAKAAFKINHVEHKNSRFDLI